MYGELEEMFENEEVQQEAHRDRNFVDTVQLYIARMMKDKNQNNYHRSNLQLSRFEMCDGFASQL